MVHLVSHPAMWSLSDSTTRSIVLVTILAFRCMFPLLFLALPYYPNYLRPLLTSCPSLAPLAESSAFVSAGNLRLYTKLLVSNAAAGSIIGKVCINFGAWSKSLVPFLKVSDRSLKNKI